MFCFRIASPLARRMTRRIAATQVPSFLRRTAACRTAFNATSRQ